MQIELWLWQGQLWLPYLSPSLSSDKGGGVGVFWQRECCRIGAPLWAAPPTIMLHNFQSVELCGPPRTREGVQLRMRWGLTCFVLLGLGVFHYIRWFALMWWHYNKGFYMVVTFLVWRLPLLFLFQHLITSRVWWLHECGLWVGVVDVLRPLSLSCV